MPFTLSPIEELGRQQLGGRLPAGPSGDRIVRDPGGYTGAPAPSGGGYYGAPAPAPGMQRDPRATGGSATAIDMPQWGDMMYRGPQSEMGSMGGAGGYYGSPYPMEGDPFGDISRSLEAALMAMQNQLSEQQMSWLEESRRRQAELSALEEAKKKRRLLGSKGRAGNILSAGSGITAQGAPVSKAVLY